jgi:hypothetical protein
MDGENSVIGFELVMEDEDELKDGAS